MKKKKIYVLMLSRLFPASHPKAGERTYFREKIVVAGKLSSRQVDFPKLHTIRANYEFWKKRMEEIQRGEAILSIRQWEGKPYRSKQAEILQLGAEDGIGIQQLLYEDKLFEDDFFKVNGQGVDIIQLAHNDGLTFDNWADWFKHYDLSKPLAIIHFTPFRY